MNIIYILIPINLLFLILAIYFFFFGVKNNQFENFLKNSKDIIFQDINDFKKKKKK